MESDFLLQSGRLIGVWQHISPTDKEHIKIDLLSEEAMRTSAIEGEMLDRDSVQSSIRRQFGLKTDRNAGPAESGIAELMVACFEAFEQRLTHEILYDWHQLVCRGRTDLNMIGAYRAHPEPMQVVSGPIGKEKVHFEAPPSDSILEEMRGFIDWFVDTGPNGKSPLPPLTRAGLAHLYFVSVHPFEDGNGRVGRALCHKALAQHLKEPSLLALSREIEDHRKAYYDALEENNKNMDVTDWLVWFGKTVLSAQRQSMALIDHLVAKTRMLDELLGQINQRQERALVRLFAAGPDGFIGGLSAKNYITITRTSAATARRDLGDLVNKKALTRTGERKGTRYWLNLERSNR